MEEIRLPDLEVIRRFSIAVRSEHAPADEVLAALRADLEAVTRAARSGGSRRASASEREHPGEEIVLPSKSAAKPARRPSEPARRTPARRTPARRSSSRSSSRRSR